MLPGSQTANLLVQHCRHHLPRLLTTTHTSKTYKIYTHIHVSGESHRIRFSMNHLANCCKRLAGRTGPGQRCCWAGCWQSRRHRHGHWRRRRLRPVPCGLSGRLIVVIRLKSTHMIGNERVISTARIFGRAKHLQNEASPRPRQFCTQTNPVVVLCS